jgi:glycogen synthase
MFFVGSDRRFSLELPWQAKRMTRKLLIYSYDWLPLVGGIQTVTLDLARGISEWSEEHSGQGWEVTLVTQTPGDGMDDSGFPFRVFRRPSTRELVRLFFDADVLHFAGPSLMPLVFAQLIRRPLVIEHHGFQACCPNGLLFYEPDKSPCPGHFMARRYSKCLACNHQQVGMRKSISRLLSTIVRRFLCNLRGVNVMPTAWLGTVLGLQHSVTIHHGVSVDNPPETRSFDLSGLTIACQGRLVSTKGIDVLLSAAEQLQSEGIDFRILIIGDGPERGVLETQAKRLRRGSVVFLGQVASEELADVLSGVTIVAMPSLGGEVFGLVAAESMLRGKAVAVSSIGSLREVVGETGVSFDIGSVEGLASCLRPLLKNNAQVAAMGAAAKERAERIFSKAAMIQRHIAIYEKALHES